MTQRRWVRFGLAGVLAILASACASDEAETDASGADASGATSGAGGSAAGGTGGNAAGGSGGSATGGTADQPTDATSTLPDAALPDAAAPAPDAAPPAPDMGPLPGGDRPSRFYLPQAPAPAAGYPLVLLLHGYMAGSTLIDRQFGFSPRVDELGFALLVPDGLQDADGAQRWNTERPVEGSPDPDDIAYLTGLVRETMARYPIDPGRIYVVGHSNGGYMAFRLGCDAPDLFTGIVPASALYRIDPATCVSGPPVNVLHVHGDRDGAHPFEGAEGELGVNALVEMWAARNHCPMEPPPVEQAPFDAELTVPGPETIAYVYTGCDAGTSVGRWRMQNVGHVFIVTPEGTRRLLTDLLAMRRAP